MAFKRVTPAEAHSALLAEAGAAYLDVRTEEEFARGHPPGAINVPLAFFQRPGESARPNENFVAEVGRALAADREIFVGCQVGGRSQRACEILSGAGFTKLANVEGGFGGLRDRAGNLVAPGWADSGLPVETGQPPGRSYADLKSRG